VLDRAALVYSTFWHWGELLAHCVRSCPGAAHCVATAGIAFSQWTKHYFLGFACSVAGDLTSDYGLASLSALAVMELETNPDLPQPILSAVKHSHQASGELAMTKGVDRSRGVQAIAQAFEAASDEILEANTLDLEISREMAVPEAVLKWLKLTPERLQKTIGILQRLGEVPDPLQQVVSSPEQLNLSQSYHQRMPLGAITFVYEAFPELGAIAAGLCLKTGNSLILRGGSEASHSHAAITGVLQAALGEVGFPKGALEMLTSEQGSSIQELVTQNQYLNLVIPYGRPSLVQQVAQLATVPVLRTAMGNCYLYWSASGDLELVRATIVDSHASEPDSVNAIEKVLIPASAKHSSLLKLFHSLKEKGFKLRGEEELVEAFPEQLTLANASEWNSAYLDRIVAFKVVDSTSSAINWINQHSSGHADCLITESYQESRAFALGIDSALVYINSSPRFSRESQRGDSVFLGMSNQKGYRRGLIGLETLTTFKQVVHG